MEPSMPAKVVLAAVFAFVAVTANAQVIQKWKTPDGSLYFGDKPPAGSTKTGEEGSAAAAATKDEDAPMPASTSAAARDDDGFSVKLSNARTKIERALRQDAARLTEIRGHIDNVKRMELRGDPNGVASGYDIAETANFQAKKEQALRDLNAQEREAYADIGSLWKAFDDLNADVREHYGREPDWWRSRIECGECPSRLEAENALR
jgi:hypothetical protein